MPDQAKWHEGQADAIDHFLLDLEWALKQAQAVNPQPASV